MKRIVSALLLLASVGVTLVGLPTPALATTSRPNVVIIISDDQRRDKVTAEYMPNVWELATNPSSIRPAAQSIDFSQNSFVSNPLCCPSRTTILTGKYSHTTGVWGNHGAYGGFSVFNDKHTLAVDFQQQDYRTAMIGKYLNGYVAGKMRYVPPGWSKWFASNGGAYYNWGVTTKTGTRHYGDRAQEYSTRVLQNEALDFVTKDTTTPFFLYFSLSAPHGPAIPDPRDVGRFKGEPDFSYPTTWPSSALDSAYGVDRAVGQLLGALPDNTVILFMSDNGLMWNDETIRGVMSGKGWPYNESIRVPMVYASLDGTNMPNAIAGDIVANVDLRTTLLHAVGLVPLTSQEGINWFNAGYVQRDHLLIEHYMHSSNPTYCGIRSADYMYARFHEPDKSYTEELYQESVDPTEVVNLAGNPDYEDLRQQMHNQAKAECDPAPPNYSWRG